MENDETDDADAGDGASKIVVGCAGLSVPRRTYANKLTAIELREAQAQVPGAKAARGWRDELGACAVALPAWQLVCGAPSGASFRGVQKQLEPGQVTRYGGFRDTPEVADAFAQTVAAADALKARAIVFNCDVSFTPTAEHEKRLRRFFSETPRDGRLFVLSLRGVWEPTRAAELAAELDVVLAVDPLDEEAAQAVGPVAYFQLPGPVMGRYRYDDDDLEGLLTLCEDFDEAWCIFCGPAMWDEARSFRKLTDND